jgi:hypothetical protein
LTPGARNAVDSNNIDRDTTKPGTRYAIPPRITHALERIFANPDFAAPDIRSIPVIYSPAFVRAHLVLVRGSRGSVTRPGRIYTNLAEDVFFALDFHVLHEFYHVVQQWGREHMSVLGYLFRARQREREANEFARQNLEEYRKLLGCWRGQ